MKLLLAKMVITDAQFLDTEVGPQSPFNGPAAFARNSALEDLELLQVIVILYQLCYGFGADVLDVAVSEIEVLQLPVGL